MIEELKAYYTNFESFYSEYFQNYKPIKNNEWLVKCPFHDDKTPSMTVNTKTGMFNCFGCNAKGDFIKFYMDINNKDFKTALDEMCNKAGITKQKIEYKIVKTYDYIDVNNNLVSQTVRFEPKKFSQRRMVNNKWVWNLQDTETVLYNLSAVIKAKQVLILEGEKDCDNAIKHGFTATTCPMGAKSWQQKFNKILQGKEIILCPDNDPVGIEHMKSIGEGLQGKATIKWADLGGKTKGFDLSDFLEPYKDNEFEAIDALDKIIRSARVFKAENIIIPVEDSKESEAIKQWIKASPGEFNVKDLDYELGFKEPDQKVLRTKILEKFVSEKLISREGKRRGTYRPYQIELLSMDYLSSQEEYLPIWLPMGMHKLVKIMHGNIIIVAGESNAGKTAFMLNIIRSNMNRFNIHYFNSEMGGGELKSRLNKFDDIGINEWKFNAYSRSNDFADVVFAGENTINIIDFLEMTDNFYLIGEKITQIHKALNGAIAVIAIQKNKGNEMAIGGNRTMEKARLVVNVEPGKFKITKAKNFVNPEVNPNYMQCDWKLVQGHRFIMKSTNWYKN